MQRMGKLDVDFFQKFSQYPVDLNWKSLSTILSTLSYVKTESGVWESLFTMVHGAEGQYSLYVVNWGNIMTEPIGAKPPWEREQHI